MDKLDAAILDALNTAPLESPPPGLFSVVMAEVNTRGRGKSIRGQVSVQTRPSPVLSRPTFHVSWLDVALSFFGAGVVGAIWLAWEALSPQWVAYWLLYAQWSVLHAWYADRDIVLWCAFALAALFTGLLAAGLSCARLGICSRRV